MKKAKNKIKIGITMGDPSGIGPEIIAKALPKLRGLAEFVIIGDRWVFSQGSKVKGKRLKVKGQGPWAEFIDLANVRRKTFSFGKIKAEYGRASIEYLDSALDLIRSGEIESLVTCPISKEAINLAGYKYSGHTEYLAQKTASTDTVMMLVNKKLNFSLLTRHLPLKDLPRKISQSALRSNLLITYHGLKKLFAIQRPRLVVCGLNPHASDNGLIGREELEVIAPAVKKLSRKLNAVIEGPLSADVAIYRASRREYDCVIAIYHDQALIPLKLTGGETGVNLTIGLPFIRTSPLHGTAFDIAGRYQKACPRSLIEAVRLALRCSLNLKRN